MKEEFSTTAMFQYNRSHKLRFAFILYGVMFLAIIFAASYYFFLQHMEIAFFEFFRQIITHIKDAIASASILGILYTSVFGGLFFVTIPLELVFISFLRNGANPFFLIITFIGGFVISFTINYIIGMKLDTLSKKIINPQKFYKIKGILNRYGAIAVLVINAIPFLPAQPLATILGVFKYNKAKFYVYFISGQLLKFTAITIIYIYIIGLPGVTS